jgi:hypothetical protein
VSSRMEPYWKSFQIAKLRAAWLRRKIEKGWDGNHAAGRQISSVPTGRAVLKNLWKKHASTFDFCKLSCPDMLKRLQELNDPQQQPVVMIGHAKDFLNDRQFEEFLATLSHRGNVRFMSIPESLHGMLCMLRAPRAATIVDTASRGR